MKSLCVFLALMAAGALRGEPPAVLRVEPPDWWAGHSINPVRLLLRGRALDGARVAASGGPAVRNVRRNAAGTYLFADLDIPPEQPAGDIALTVTTAGGSAVVPYHLNPKLTEGGRLPGFTSRDVVYLIMPDRFADGDPANDDPPISRGLFDRRNPHAYHGGDFAGVIEHLPYLKELGVTAIWMTPIYDNSDRKADYHGYGAIDYYGVEEHFGDLALLEKLVREAHRLGIKVIQDQVANHTGPQHPWVADPPAPGWFHGTAAAHTNESWLVWSLPDPSTPAEVRRSVLDGWFANVLPDLNQENPEVAAYEIQNTLWWIGKAGFDGIRQDTWPYVPRAFWRDWMAAIKRQFPTVKVVGEVLDGDPVTVSYFQGGRARDGIDTGVDALFDYPLYFKMRDAFGEGQPLMEVPKMLAHDDLYPNARLLWIFLGDHDEPRLMNYGGASEESVKLGYTCLFALRGVPLLYYGDEIGMRGGADPDNRRDFPGGWPGDARNAFTAAGRNPEEQAIFAHIARLAHLRSTVPALSAGRSQNLVLRDRQWVFTRQAGDSLVMVALNSGQSPAEMRVSAAGRDWKGLLGVVAEAHAADGVVRVTLPPVSGEIFEAVR